MKGKLYEHAVMLNHNTFMEGMHLQPILDETKREFPLNPMIEALSLLHESELQQVYFNNCNLQRFIEETIQWFEENFGDE